MRKRLLMLLAVGLLLAQATLAESFLHCRACTPGTSDDDCPSGCETCLCCAMARVAMTPTPEVCALTPMGAVVPPPVLPLDPADARDIFHVPKLSLS